MKNRKLFKIWCLSFIVILSTSAIAICQNKNLIKIEQIMEQQTVDWNNGDIDGFMEAYWKSEKLQFGGAKGLTFGWNQTLENYKKGYPDQSAMGKLKFTIKVKEQLSKKTAMVVGKWELEREKDEPNGHFMLIWKKIKGDWLIIADHTSSSCLGL